MSYVIKDIVYKKVSKEDGEEKERWVLNLLDDVTGQKVLWTFFKSPKYAAGDVIEITDKKIQQKLTEAD